MVGIESVLDAEWKTARKRADILRPLAALDVCPVHLARAAALDLQISERWAYVLIRRLREQGGELTALLPGRGRGGPRQTRIAGDREAIISEIIDTKYLTRQKFRPAEIVRIINARCHKEGFSAPSEATIRRRLRNISQEAVSKNRELQPQTQPIVGATPIPEFPLDVLQMDHTMVDVILVDAVEREPIGRPYLTVAIDIMSRAIAGFYLSLDAPSATSVGLCLTHVATDKAAWMAECGVSDVEWPIMGKPKALGVDNGADFHSKAFERGCAQHGITIDWRPPGQPQFGGAIERIIGTLMMRIHRLPGTTFSNTAQRGAYNSERRACLTLEELEKWLTLVICKDYHQSPHRGIDAGTPMMRLKEGLTALKKAENGPIIPRDLHSYLIDFLPIFRRTLQRDGFTIDHIRYFSNALKPWISSRVARVQGSMILRRDPRDLSRIYVLDPFDGSYLEVPFRTLSRPAITLWEHRAALRRARERNTAQVNEDMIFTAFEEMQEIERNAVRLSKKARRRKARPEFKQPSNASVNTPVKERSGQNSDEATSAPRPFSDIEEW